MDVRNPESNQSYSLIMLGTDTAIEGINADGSVTPLDGYERGETLNAIFRNLEGEEFNDKHIVSGPEREGCKFDQKAAEGTLMALKAISEGKTTIQIAAHSRGAVESIIIAHKLEEILNLIRNGATEATFKEALLKILVEKTASSNLAINCIISPKQLSPKTKEKNQKTESNAEKDLIQFKTYQEKTTEDKTTHIKKSFIKENEFELDTSKLFKALSDPVKISCELFLMDPVPGQEKSGNWTIDKFFVIPNIVKKVEVLYQKDERTYYFEPILIDKTKIPAHCKLKITPLPGHHGTASGNLDQQNLTATKVINSDNDEKKGNRGKKTRHVQKLVIGKLVSFFNMKPGNENIEKQVNPRKTVPSIQKTINSCRIKNLQKESRNHYFKKRYEKMDLEKSEYSKFQDTGYGALTYISPYKRKVLTSTKSTIAIDDVKALHTPPGGYINDEHIRLTIKEFMKSDMGASKNGIDFISEKLTFFTECFKKPTGEHPNKKNIIQSNQVVIDYFCKNDTPHIVSGYFYSLLDPLMSNAVTSLISEEFSDRHQKIIEDCKNTLGLIKTLLESIDSFSKMPNNKQAGNAKILHDEITSSLETTLGNMTNQFKGVISGLENEHNILSQNPENTAKNNLALKIKFRNKLSFINKQLDETLNKTGLFSDHKIEKFKAKFTRLLDNSYSSIKSQIDEEKLKRLTYLQDIESSREALKLIPASDAHRTAVGNINLLLERINSSDSLTLDSINTIRTQANQVIDSLQVIRNEYLATKIEQDKKIISLQGQGAFYTIKATDFEITDDSAQILLNDFSLQANNLHIALASKVAHLRNDLNDSFTRKEEELKTLHEKIDLINTLCNEKTGTLLAIERIVKKEVENEAGNEQHAAAIARIQRENNQKLIDEKASKDAEIANLNTANQAQIAQLNTQIQQLQNDASFNSQINRLILNINQIQGAKDPIKKQMQIILNECNTLHASGKASAAQLTQTLKVANDFFEAPVAQKDYQSLGNEARYYANSNRKSFHALGGSLIALGILCGIAAIAVGVLTLGLGLIPLSVLYASIFTGSMAVVSASLSIGGGCSLFSSKHPRLHDALIKCTLEPPQIA